MDPVDINPMYVILESAFVDTVELEIGGQLIDKHTGTWLEVWSELTEPNEGGSTSSGMGILIIMLQGAFQRMTACGGLQRTLTNSAIEYPLFIPLRFWFCRNPGLALPLIAFNIMKLK